MDNELYNRQKTLNLKIEKKVAVLGAGGIGSNLIVELALVGVEEIVVVDFDTVEESNRNRTPFRDCDVGKTKIRAIEEIVTSMRVDCIIIGIEKRLEELSKYELSLFDCPIIDCRDNIDLLPPEINKHLICKLGYDGFECTMDYLHQYDKIFDDGLTGYQITPSFSCPPRLLAILFVLNLVTGVDPKRIINFDIRNILTKL